MKFCSKCGDEISTKDGVNVCAKCEDRPRQGAKQSRKERHELLTSMGLTKVRGAMGGTYYE